MATIESKNLLVWVKAMSRGQALPLDSSEIHGSLAEAQSYAATATAYAGQTIKALLEDGKYHEYILQPTEAGYTLEEVGAIKQSDLKQYVMVVDALPESGQEQGVLYIKDTTGSIWTGTEWKEVFWDVTANIAAIDKKIGEIEDALDEKAPIANPVFSGVVKVGEEEVALKSYVESLFAQLEEVAVPEIVNSENPIATEYKAGMTYRVAEAGTYVGQECEVGDLILVVKDYVAETASNDDFMVVQANIDGAVTSVSDVTTVGEIVVFDSVTGKVIKGAGVQIASLNDAIAKAHEHSNKTQLDSYNKTQDELLADALSSAQALVTAHETAVSNALEGKADKATTLAGYGITDAYTSTVIDGKLQTITENLNTKITATDVDSKIATAKTETLEEAANAATEALETRVGSIPADTTIQSYIDTAVGSGGTASAQAIAQAKSEAIESSKTYTDEQITATVASQKTYIDDGDANTLASAKTYTDEEITKVYNAITVAEF